MPISGHVGQTFTFRGHNHHPPDNQAPTLIDGWAEVNAKGKPTLSKVLEHVGGSGDTCSVRGMRAGETFVVAIAQDPEGDPISSIPFAVVVLEDGEEPTRAQAKLLDKKAKVAQRLSDTWVTISAEVA